MGQTFEGRHEQILHQVLREGSVEVESMAAQMGVSPSTVRRGLRDLESRGLLRRTHGGAVPVEAPLYEPFRYDASFQEQEGLRAEEKRRIGFAAASLIRDGETIAISAGTTATQVARCLRSRLGITIVTNAVNIAMGAEPLFGSHGHHDRRYSERRMVLAFGARCNTVGRGIFL